MIYLDNAASTRVLPEALAEMMPYLEGAYGNPSSIHRLGREAARALRLARRRVAALIGAAPAEVTFTSGGTESNNLAIRGAAAGHAGGRVVTTAVEHDAVLEPCRALEREGFEVAYVAPDGEGAVSAADVAAEITPDTRLVSVMLANNEVGTLQPVREVAAACRRAGVPLHTDAAQAAGKVPVDVGELGADLVSVSSHKLGGPKGAGALYARRGSGIAPLLLGGGQEGGMRSGTENVACIAGFGRACEAAAAGMAEGPARVARLRDRLAAGVAARIPRSEYNGRREGRLPGNAHFTFLGVSGEDLIIKLDEAGVAASTGSACSVRTQKESHVLRAMGFSHERIAGSLRLSVGPSNTEADIDGALDALCGAVAELRRVSPLRERLGL